MQGDLFPELLRGIQKRQRMVVRLGKQFHASGGHQFPEALDDFRRVGLELIERVPEMEKLTLNLPSYLRISLSRSAFMGR